MFPCRWITPERSWEEEVESLILPSLDGKFGVLSGHAPLLGTLLEGGIIQVRTKSQKEEYRIQGGFVKVLDNSVLILTSNAEKLAEKP